MESSIARYFNEKVDALMGEDGRKPRLYSTLSLYQQDHNLTGLITNLKKVLNQPHLAELFDDIRTLIPTKHQLPYSRLAPHPPPAAPIVIRLNRTNSDASLGFAVRGGLEHGVGIYVSQVIPNSTAAKQGLQVGDEIVRINGFTISQAIHLEVLNLIRHRAELVLKVRHMGMLPVKEGEEVSWHYLDTDYTDSQEEAGDEDGEERLEEVKLFIHLPVGGILGCRVCSGPPGMEGIFVSSVRPNGYAEVAGLTPGDQILSVNGTSFINVTHGEALVALKASRNILLLIRKAAARELFLPSKAHVDWQGLPRNDNRPAPVTITPDENGNVNSTVPPPVGWVDEPLKQIDLIQQAIRVIEEKEVTVVALADPRSAVEVAAEVHPMPQSNSDSPGVSAGNTTLSSTHPSPTGSNTSSTGNLNKPIHQPIASNPSPTKPPTRVGTQVFFVN